MDKFKSESYALNYHIFLIKKMYTVEMIKIQLYLYLSPKNIVCNTINTLCGYYSATVHLLKSNGTYSRRNPG